MNEILAVRASFDTNIYRVWQSLMQSLTARLRVHDRHRPDRIEACQPHSVHLLLSLLAAQPAALGTMGHRAQKGISFTLYKTATDEYLAREIAGQ